MRRTLATSAPGRIRIISMARIFTDVSSKSRRRPASFIQTCRAELEYSSEHATSGRQVFQRTAPRNSWSTKTAMAFVAVVTATAMPAAAQKPKSWLNAAVMTTPPARYSGTPAIHGIKTRSPCGGDVSNERVDAGRGVAKRPHRSGGDEDCDGCTGRRVRHDGDEPDEEERERLLQPDDDADEAQADAHRLGRNRGPVPVLQHVELLRHLGRELGEALVLARHLGEVGERPALADELVQHAAASEASVDWLTSTKQARGAPERQEKHVRHPEKGHQECFKPVCAARGLRQRLQRSKIRVHAPPVEDASALSR